MSVNQIGQLASGLLEYEFDYITGEQTRLSELNTISGSLSGRIGELNVLINQSFAFTGQDGNVYPPLGQEEGDILQLLYIRDYNSKQAQKLLRGIYDVNTQDSIVNANGDWIELSEGDTTIRRSPTALANSPAARMSTSKEFKDLAKEADDRLQELVYKYNMYGAEPIQVAGLDAADLEFKKDCKYGITLDGDNGSQQVIDASSPYPEGQLISLQSTPDAGYTFDSWHVLSPAGLTITNDTFTMPAENVSISGQYVAIDYDITLAGDNGSQIVVSPAAPYNVNDFVTLQATPDAGYTFDSWHVLSPAGLTITNDTFTMPAENVSISGQYVI